jgi:hypothetical protein
MLSSRVALALLLGAAPACSAPAADPAPVDPAPVAYRAEHVEPVTGVRFPVVDPDLTVAVRHHDPSLPAHKFKHSFRLARDGRVVVLVDVWEDPERRSLAAWYDAHLAFLDRAPARRSERPMGRAGESGILVEIPPSPQARGQVVAVLAHGGRVVRVTGMDPESDPAARRVFDALVADFDFGGAP